MKRYFSILTLAALALVIHSCKKGNKLTQAPVISDLRMSNNIVHDGNSPVYSDTVTLVFTMKDGNGDFGTTDNDTAFRIFLKDSADNNIVYGYTYPEIPRELVDPSRGLVASCTVRIDAKQKLILKPVPPGNPPRTMDSVKFHLYVVDDARNESNIITTPYIYIIQ